MPIESEFVCLANSRKMGGRCLAGIQVERGRPVGWIRPISHRPGAAVSARERQFQDGSEPKLLDLCRVRLLHPLPVAHQSENWLLDASQRWRRMGRWGWDALLKLQSAPEPLWLTGEPSTRHGKHDRVSESRSRNLRDSLRLVSVPELSIRVFSPGADRGHNTRRVQGSFTYLGEEYRLWVTDPEVESVYHGRGDGEYALKDCYLTVSLGERTNDGFCYKLIAGVLTRGRAEHAV